MCSISKLEGRTIFFLREIFFTLFFSLCVCVCGAFMFPHYFVPLQFALFIVPIDDGIALSVSSASAVNMMHQNIPNMAFSAAKSTRRLISTVLCRQKTAGLYPSQPPRCLSSSSVPKPTAVRHQRPIYVAATKQHVGKTSVSLALVSHFSKRFGPENVGYMKAVG